MRSITQKDILLGGHQLPRALARGLGLIFLIGLYRSDKSRAFSMILYLNEQWVPEDGGELRIYHSDHVQTIAPLSGQCVFFKSSELEHEVLLTQAPRMSITGWLKVG